MSNCNAILFHFRSDHAKAAFGAIQSQIIAFWVTWSNATTSLVSFYYDIQDVYNDDIKRYIEMNRFIISIRIMIIYFYCTYKREKILHCLLWNLGHQNVLSPGHEKIRTVLCPNTNFLFYQNYLIFTVIFCRRHLRSFLTCIRVFSPYGR